MACEGSGTIAAHHLDRPAVAVVAEKVEHCPPCGGCRQRIREFAAPTTPIHIAGPEGVRASFTLAELLPESFGPEHLSV